MARVRQGGEMTTERERAGGLFAEREKAVDEAVRRAVEHALLTHERAGNRVASWRDGKVVIIPAVQIPVGIVEDTKRE